MFNFTLFSKALVDSNLTDAEFRLLCLILNNLSMSGSDEIEMKIPFIMDKLDKCERQARNLLSALANKNYIIREVIGTTKNRHGNIISLIDDERKKIATNDDAVIAEKNCAISEENNVEKNCPPYNDYILINKSINKSILINREKSIEENIDYIDLGEASNESDTSTNEVNNEETNETISNDSNTSTEGNKPIETRTPSSNEESNTSINTTTNESNKTISADEAIKWLNSKLDEYYNTKRPNQSQSIEINITNYFQSIDKQYFNPNQLRAISALEKRFNGIRSQKQKYFSKWNKCNTSINSNNTLSPQVAPAPLSQNSTIGDEVTTPNTRPSLETSKTINNELIKAKIQDYESWYLETIPNFVNGKNFERQGMEKAIANRLENEFGNNWWLSSDKRTIETATAIEDKLMEDLDYFVNVSWPNALKEYEANTPSTENEQQDGNIDGISSTAPEKAQQANDTNELIYYDDGTIVELPF